MALTLELAALEAAGQRTSDRSFATPDFDRGVSVGGFSCGDITRGELAGAKEREDSGQLRQRANIGCAISVLSLVVGLAGLAVALLK